MVLTRDDDGRLVSASGRVFDAWDWQWSKPESGRPGAEPLTASQALRVVTATPRRRLLPVGVIGPKAASARQYETARVLGRALAGLGLPVLSGGREGVMEAVAEGASGAGGLCLAFLPDDDWRTANAHVAMPLATGIGKARNVLIAQASLALIAIGGEYGTLSEIAFGLHFGKPVFALEDAPDIRGVEHHGSVGSLCEALAARLLGDPAD